MRMVGVWFSLIVWGAAGPAAGAGNGAKIFSSKCVSCHGKDGKGNPNMAKLFHVKPAAMDLTNGALLPKKDADLATLIAKGKEGKMPAFAGKLKAEEINDLVLFIRGLNVPKKELAGKKEGKAAEKEKNKKARTEKPKAAGDNVQNAVKEK